MLNDKRKFFVGTKFFASFQAEPYSTTKIQLEFVRNSIHTYTISVDGGPEVPTNAQPTMTIRSLSPGTQYSFELFATRATLKSAASTSISACTYQLAPIDFEYTLVDGVTATLTWSNAADVGRIDSYVVDSLGTSPIPVASAATLELNVSLTELATDEYSIYSIQNCPSSGDLNSDKVYLEVQAGIDTFNMSMDGRRSYKTSEFSVDKGNALTKYTYVYLYIKIKKLVRGCVFVYACGCVCLCVFVSDRTPPTILIGRS